MAILKKVLRKNVLMKSYDHESIIKKGQCPLGSSDKQFFFRQSSEFEVHEDLQPSYFSPSTQGKACVSKYLS